MGSLVRECGGSLGRGALRMYAVAAALSIPRPRSGAGCERGARAAVTSPDNWKLSPARERRIDPVPHTTKRAHSQLRRHQPHQTPGERLFQRPAIELVPLGGIQRHHPAGMVNRPGAIPAAGGDGIPKGRCLIGWIVAEGGRTSYDVWLDLHTGEGRLRRQTR
jgi:hypothetical protein